MYMILRYANIVPVDLLCAQQVSQIVFVILATILQELANPELLIHSL